ncbi:hypothetical protein LCGC14_2191520 [marine sediment metagenome]|uniref:Uncharacterized protein n=1 Tax=marine sediment metagenome TaxID=412755 RepID=A0A0F9DJG3_9ZZZZ
MDILCSTSNADIMLSAIIVFITVAIVIAVALRPGWRGGVIG